MDNQVQDSFFRSLMNSLKSTEFNDRQAAPDWQRVIRRFLEVQVEKEIRINRQYTGKEILINRSGMDEREPDSERNACLNFYQQILAQEDRSLQIDNDSFRLIGYEVPNQFNLRGRRADFLGVNARGGLVVFEAKLNQKAGTPFYAVLEGLDYLVALLHESNFSKLRTQQTKDFNVADNPSDAEHEVVVFAPNDYYSEPMQQRIQNANWSFLHDYKLESSPCIRIRFAMSPFCTVNGFNTQECSWVKIREPN